ncbi:MAG: UDP-forming cellulose synthase catalytic subunit [Nitrospinota bacterium]|nr:UDP-forming cellulose synthase catalytic subunit [Nitrospinota bacterium]
MDSQNQAPAAQPRNLNQRVFLQSLLVALTGGLSIYMYVNFETYFSVHTQMYIGWSAFGLLFFVYLFDGSRRAPWRIFVILVSFFLSLRYIYWRAFDTLLFTGPFDFLGMAVLFLAELHALGLHLLSMVINIWPLDRKPIPLPDDQSLLPTVDVFIPTYTESIDIVKVTAMAASNMNYPKDKLFVHILDDGGTIARRNNPKIGEESWARHYQMRVMAKEIGVNYITREDNSHAKAGNINHALDVSSGDLILVLDCDHVPTMDLLQNTVGQFLADDKMYLVQTPHFFINPTPIEKNLPINSRLPVENDMFFQMIHPGLDSWNASYFCGSAAILRRKHLEEVGGVRGKTITEDAETSLALHARGLNSAYINRPMICGLSPETFNDYVTQRTRWAQGMTQIFLMNNLLFMPGLTLMQRLAYFNSCFFWFFGLSRFVFYIAPAMFLMFNLQVYHASLLQVLAYALPYVFSVYVMMDFLYGKSRAPLFSNIYESVQSLFLIPAVISVMLNPTKPTFKITPKGSTQEKEFINPLASSFMAVVLINVVALGLAGVKWIEYPIYRDVIYITGGWCVFNIFMSILSLGAFWERRQVRKHHRILAKGEVRVYFPRLIETFHADLTDISLSGLGMKVRLPQAVGQDERAQLTVKDSYGNMYNFDATVKRVFKRGDMYNLGSEFIAEKETFANAIRFVYGDSQRWVDVWSQEVASGGYRVIIIHFFMMGLKGLVGVSISMAGSFWEYIQDGWKHYFTRLKKSYAYSK